MSRLVTDLFPVSSVVPPRSPDELRSRHAYAADCVDAPRHHRPCTASSGPIRTPGSPTPTSPRWRRTSTPSAPTTTPGWPAWPGCGPSSRPRWSPGVPDVEPSRAVGAAAAGATAGVTRTRAGVRAPRAPSRRRARGRGGRAARPAGRARRRRHGLRARRRARGQPGRPLARLVGRPRRRRGLRAALPRPARPASTSTRSCRAPTTAAPGRPTPRSFLYTVHDDGLPALPGVAATCSARRSTTTCWCSRTSTSGSSSSCARRGPGAWVVIALLGRGFSRGACCCRPRDVTAAPRLVRARELGVEYAARARPGPRPGRRRRVPRHDQPRRPGVPRRVGAGRRPVARGRRSSTRTRRSACWGVDAFARGLRAVAAPRRRRDAASRRRARARRSTCVPEHAGGMVRLGRNDDWDADARDGGDRLVRAPDRVVGPSPGTARAPSGTATRGARRRPRRLRVRALSSRRPPTASRVPVIVVRHRDTPLDGTRAVRALRLRLLRGAVRPGLGHRLVALAALAARPWRRLRGRPPARRRRDGPPLVGGRPPRGEARTRSTTRRRWRECLLDGVVSCGRHARPVGRRPAAGRALLAAARRLFARRRRRGAVRRRRHLDARRVAAR